MKTGKIRTGAIISLIMVVMIALFLIFGVLNHKQMIYYSGRLFISTNEDVSEKQPGQLTQFYESITYSDGNVAFTIPDGDDVWNIQINGRIHVDGAGEMSIHYLEEECESNSWEGGETYSFDVSGAKYSRFTELYLDAQLNNEERSIDILEFLPKYLKMTGDLEESDR
ncbi:MAG: hypothetical protein J6K48_09980 [Lachnospiraceae bacterium]|nr:hypothetical protein [Lachnospiraceae bacterium]